MYRGLIHFHSQYSYDSVVSIESIVKFALKNQLNFLVLTDHDTIQGSVALKEYIEKNNIPLEVVVAAEYATSLGDIIALDIKEEITNLEFDNFIKNVKEQNGLLLFPHPYKGHKNIEYIAKQMDMIEIFNARTDDASNLKAEKLASTYNKKTYYSTDAHNQKSLKHAIIELEKNGTLKESLQRSEIVPITKSKSYQYEVLLSQYVKAYKKKNLKLFISLSIHVIRLALKLKILQKV